MSDTDQPPESLDAELEQVRQQALAYGKDFAALYKAEKLRSEELRAERDQLQQVRNQLQRLVDSSPAVIYSCNRDGVYGTVFVSDNIRAQLGYTPQQFLSDPSFWISRLHPEDLTQVTAQMPRLYENDSLKLEYRVQHADGRYRWMQDHMTLHRDKDGKPVEIVGCWLDITRERRVKEMRQEMLNLLARQLHAPMASLMEMSRLLDVESGRGEHNEALAAIKASADKLHRSISDLLIVADVCASSILADCGVFNPGALLRATWEKSAPQFLAKNIRCEFFIDDTLQPVPGDSRMLERAVEELFANACEFAPIGSVVSIELAGDGADHVVIAVEDDGPVIPERERNAVFEEFFQKDRVRSRHSDGMGLGLSLVRHTAEFHGGTAYAEAPQKMRGARIVIRLPAHKNVQQSELERLKQELEAAQKQNLAYAADVARGYAAEREKTTVLNKTKEQLARSAKLATLGEMVAAIAHDVGNMIAPVGGYADLLAMNPGLPEGCKKYTSRIQDAANRATTMLRSLMNFGSRRSSKPSGIVLKESVKAALALLEYNLTRKGVRIALDIDPDLPLVYADAGQIEQVLVNLMVNAQHAMDPRGGGELCISAHSENRRVRISITDQGVGIPPHILDRVFEPFFTTKSEGKGTGLGLFICHQIAELHGGAMEVESAVGVGTTFSFTLPEMPKIEAARNQ